MHDSNKSKLRKTDTADSKRIFSNSTGRLPTGKSTFYQGQNQKDLGREKRKSTTDQTQKILKNYSGYDGSLCGNLSDNDILTEFEIEETHEMAAEWIRNGWYVPPPRPQKPSYTKQKQDRPIETLKHKIKKVTFQDNQLTNPSTSRTKPKNRCPSVQSNKGTQTKTWKELIQSELDSDHFHDRLFNTTDTEHDSEETLVSN